MPRRLEPPFRFLIDECLGLRDVPNAMEAALAQDESLVRFQDMFARSTADEVWLRKAGAAGLVIITKDDRLRFRPNERAALLEANTAVFTVASAAGSVMAATLVQAMPTMRRVLRGQKPPVVGRVLGNGSIALHVADGVDVRKTVKRPVG